MSPIVDSHVHVWPRWPHQPPVPDPSTRASIEHLVYEMDANGVDQAVLAAARLEGQADNNDYVAAAVERYPGRFHHFADVDCVWSPEHHRPGAAARLRALAERYPIVGVSHYPGRENDGWLLSPDGLEFFAEAARLGLIVALAANPAWQEDVRTVARALPDLQIVLHHLGLVLLWKDGVADGLQRVLPAADLTNVTVKVTGFFYGQDRPWEYPLLGAVDVVRQFYDSWGPCRLMWGSESPNFRGSLSYRQSLEIVRTHCSFIPSAEMDLVLGGNLYALLDAAYARRGLPHPEAVPASRKE